jgi:hypothetical protein
MGYKVRIKPKTSEPVSIMTEKLKLLSYLLFETRVTFDTDGNCAFFLSKKAQFDFRHFLPKITLVEYR